MGISLSFSEMYENICGSKKRYGIWRKSKQKEKLYVHEKERKTEDKCEYWCMKKLYDSREKMWTVKPVLRAIKLEK